jgi:hypothetical protein
MINKIELKIMFDFKSDTCFWDIRKDHKYNLNYQDLINEYQIPELIASFSRTLSEMFDYTINWSDPHGGLYLDPEFIKIFIDLEKYIYNKLMKEQGDKYDIIYNMSWIRRDYENNLPTEPVLIRH